MPLEMHELKWPPSYNMHDGVRLAKIISKQWWTRLGPQVTALYARRVHASPGYPATTTPWTSRAGPLPSQRPDAAYEQPSSSTLLYGSVLNLPVVCLLLRRTGVRVRFPVSVIQRHIVLRHNFSQPSL